MAIRVLHIFAPNFRERFSGPVYQWRYYFTHWDDPTIEHFVLDVNSRSMKPAFEAFSFQLGQQNKGLLSQRQRLAWIFQLHRSLISLNNDYDIMHVHILWWGSLLLGVWAPLWKKSVIYETVLLDSDTPSGILRERFGRLKLELLKKYSSILAINDFLAQDYLNHGFSQEQVFLLPNSVDTELFHPAANQEEKRQLREKLELPSEAFLLLFVGSLIQRKGFDILMQAFDIVSSRDERFYLLAVGPRTKGENPSLDEGFINGLIKEIEGKPASRMILLPGLIQDRERLAELYRASDLFVFPSRKEGLPSVLLEAMAAGLAPIVSDLPVFRSIIQQDVNGIIVPSEDAGALAESLLRVSEDWELRQRIGKSARESVLNRHSYQSWQTQISRFYRALSVSAKNSQKRL